MGVRAGDGEPEAFRAAVADLRATQLRPEVQLEEAPAPQRLAPYALALTADVVDESGDDLATGRFVLLHDPAGHDGWEGHFRIVAFVRAGVEPDVAADPLLPSVGWSWLEECLDTQGAPYVAASGTVTRVASESFGSMAEREPTAEVEIRASWTATSSAVGVHLRAWAELMATAAGLPPLTPGVVALPRRRSR